MKPMLPDCNSNKEASIFSKATMIENARQPEWSKMDLKNGKSETKSSSDHEPVRRRNKTMRYEYSDVCVVNLKA